MAVSFRWLFSSTLIISLHNSIHPPERKINHPKTLCGCPCVGVMFIKIQKGTHAILSPYINYNAFVSIPGNPRVLRWVTLQQQQLGGRFEGSDTKPDWLHFLQNLQQTVKILLSGSLMQSPQIGRWRIRAELHGKPGYPPPPSPPLVFINKSYSCLCVCKW